MSDNIRAIIWSYAEQLEMIDDRDAQALWLYALSAWFPW